MKVSLKIRVLAALIFWLLFLSVDVLKKKIFSVDNLEYLLAYYLFGFLLWFLITFPLYYLFQWSQKLSTLIRVIFLLLLGPIVGGIKVILSWTSFYISLGLHHKGESLTAFIIEQGSFHFVEASIIGWVVLILFFLSELYSKYRNKSMEATELRSQLFQAQLDTLKMQLHPHFLFNAHNTISMLIRTEKYDQAIDMTSNLSELLRATLYSSEKDFIPLKDEVELIKKYLDIELIRFEDTLDINFDIPEACQSALVPNLLIQPIVENAFKHGISKHLGHSKLAFKVEKNQKYLSIQIFNTGPYLKENFSLEKNGGIGLKNTYSRLQQSYKENFLFNLSNAKDGVICTIEIPNEKD